LKTFVGLPMTFIQCEFISTRAKSPTTLGEKHLMTYIVVKHKKAIFESKSPTMGVMQVIKEPQDRRLALSKTCTSFRERSEPTKYTHFNRLIQDVIDTERPVFEESK
jgi:hypothetical protein